jgi:hypothetical protein
MRSVRIMRPLGNTVRRMLRSLFMISVKLDCRAIGGGVRDWRYEQSASEIMKAER